MASCYHFSSFDTLATEAKRKKIDFLTRSGQTIYQEITDMLITNISDASAQLSDLVEKVMAGQEVVIGNAGNTVAKLVRYEQSEKPRRPAHWGQNQDSR